MSTEEKQVKKSGGITDANRWRGGSIAQPILAITRKDLEELWGVSRHTVLRRLAEIDVTDQLALLQLIQKYMK